MVELIFEVAICNLKFCEQFWRLTCLTGRLLLIFATSPSSDRRQTPRWKLRFDLLDRNAATVIQLRQTLLDGRYKLQPLRYLVKRCVIGHAPQQV